MKKINVYGAGGHALVIADIIRAKGFEIDNFYIDNPTFKEYEGHKVIDPEVAPPTEELIIAIGNNQTRKRIANQYKAKYQTLIHPSAIISHSASFGEGTVVMQGAIVQPKATIGKHCIINTGASIDHECQIGDFVHISPHATLCGNVSVGEGAWIGAGAVVIPGIKICKNSTIGAGAVVIRDITEPGTYIGNPARRIKG